MPIGNRHFEVSGPILPDTSQIIIRPFRREKITIASPYRKTSWNGRHAAIPYFAELVGFELPNTTQGLASFYDRNGNGLYDPCDGDYPVIDIIGCHAPQYPDQMIFWIYNDAGGIHTQTQRAPFRWKCRSRRLLIRPTMRSMTDLPALQADQPGYQYHRQYLLCHVGGPRFGLLYR
ncbi:MAG: hypothetical protein H6561_21205 [Lewinellaceae bacterium]|nr:hypothetical protein [Lewinellaceae bacterium]